MRRLLITGSTGFVGNNLIAHINQNNLGVVQTLDLRTALPPVLPNHDVLIHLAGKAHDLKNVSNSQEYFAVNFDKTKELFNLFLNSGGKDFIFFSSVKAAADSIDGVLYEDSIYGDVTTPYGQSKQKAETFLLNSILPNGKRIFVFRPSMIHGPGNKGNLNLLYQFVKKGVPFPLGAFHNKRSFLSIGNLNFIIEKIISDINIAGGLYNLADDEPLSTNAIIQLLAEGIGKKAHLWEINTRIVRSIARMGDLLHLPLSTERLTKLTESYVVSNQKIKKALSINCLPISAKEGLIATIKSFNSN